MLSFPGPLWKLQDEGRDTPEGVRGLKKLVCEGPGLEWELYLDSYDLLLRGPLFCTQGGGSTELGLEVHKFLGDSLDFPWVVHLAALGECGEFERDRDRWFRDRWVEFVVEVVGDVTLGCSTG